MVDNITEVSATIDAENDATDWLLVQCGRDSVGRFGLRADGDADPVNIEVKRPGEANAAAVVMDTIEGVDAFLNGEFHVSMMVRAIGAGEFTGSSVVTIWRP